MEVETRFEQGLASRRLPRLTLNTGTRALVLLGVARYAEFVVPRPALESQMTSSP